MRPVALARGCGTVIAALAVFVSSASAQSGLTPTKPARIAAAVQSCRAALGPDELDLDRLKADGWEAGSITSEGKLVESPLQMLKRDNVLLIAMRSNDQAPNCSIMARIRSLGEFQAVSSAIQSAVGGTVAKSSAGEIAWILGDGVAAQLNATGSKQEPSVRISVIRVAETK